MGFDLLAEVLLLGLALWSEVLWTGFNLSDVLQMGLDLWSVI